MTRLIRWGHLANTDHLVAIWSAGNAEVHRSVVLPEHDLDGTCFTSVSGASLPLELFDELASDMAFAEAVSRCAPKPSFYAGVIEPATEALA